MVMTRSQDKLKKDDCKPVKPSPEKLFNDECREEHKKKHPGESVVWEEYARKCKAKWNSMSEEQKRPYVDKARNGTDKVKDEARHDADMAKDEARQDANKVKDKALAQHDADTKGNLGKSRKRTIHTGEAGDDHSTSKRQKTE